MSSTDNSKRVIVWVQNRGDRPQLSLEWIDPITRKRKSRSAETCNPVDAEQKRKDLEYELNHGLFQEPSKITWEAFREVFEQEYVAGQRAKSRQKYETVFTVFEEICNPQKLAAVDQRLMSAFVVGMRARKVKGGKTGLAPMTMKNYLVALKTALGWAKEQKFLPVVPAFPSVKVPKKKPQPIAPIDFEKLHQAAPDDLWKTYLLCGWWGGLRLSEARHLRWERCETAPWLDFPNNRIVLPAVFVKADEDQQVPLHPVLRVALELLPRTDPEVFPFRSRKGGGRLTNNGLSNRIILMARKAGVKLSMHRLRKGFGCRVAQQLGKGNAPILHSMMRHSTMQVTMDYYASVDDVLQDAMKGLT